MLLRIEPLNSPATPRRVAGLIGTAGSKAGLLPSINNIPYLPCATVDDLNEVVHKVNAGLSLLYTTAATQNRPGDSIVGLCFHLQRIARDVSGSQIVAQMMIYPNKIYVRAGYGNGNTIVGFDWRSL